MNEAWRALDTGLVVPEQHEKKSYEIEVYWMPDVARFIELLSKEGGRLLIVFPFYEKGCFRICYLHTHEIEMEVYT